MEKNPWDLAVCSPKCPEKWYVKKPPRTSEALRCPFHALRCKALWPWKSWLIFVGTCYLKLYGMLHRDIIIYIYIAYNISYINIAYIYIYISMAFSASKPVMTCI